MAHYEYEFEVLALSAGGYSLFGGVGIRTEGHQEVIRSQIGRASCRERV